MFLELLLPYYVNYAEALQNIYATCFSYPLCFYFLCLKMTHSEINLVLRIEKFEILPMKGKLFLVEITFYHMVHNKCSLN